MGPFTVSLLAAGAAFAAQVLVQPRDLDSAPTVASLASAPIAPPCLAEPFKAGEVAAPQHIPSPQF